MRCSTIIFNLILVAAFLVAPGRSSAQSTDVIQETDQAVFRIFVLGPRGSGFGTGFLVSEDGDVVTNHHVIEGGSRVFVMVKGDGRNEFVEASVVGSNAALDLAVIRAPDLAAEPLKINVADLEPGQNVFAIGFPGVADIESYSSIDDLKTLTNMLVSTVTKGDVNRVLQVEINPLTRTEFVQHSAPIREGNSGGPLLDSCGSVIGVNTFYLSDSRAIPVQSASTSSPLIGFLSINSVKHETVDRSCAGGADRTLSYILAALAAVMLAGVVFLLFRRRAPAMPTSDRDDLSRRLRRLEGDQGGRAKSGAQDADGGAMSGARSAWRLKFDAQGGKVGVRFTAADAKGGIVVGRDKSAAFTVSGSGVSRRHALLRLEDGELTIEDLGSTNGTFVDGRRLASGEKLPLGPAAEILLGKVRGAIRRE